MKFIYVSDLHCRGKNSVYRKGIYFEDWLVKLDEVISLYKKEKCAFLLMGGDLFDTHTVSNSIVDEIVDVIEKNNIQVKLIYGNHDLHCANIEASNNTSVTHILKRSKNFTLLDIYEDKDCYIKGMNYKHAIEDTIKEEGLKVDETEKWKIIVPHAFITIKPFHPDVLHVMAKDINTNADVVLCSHFHSEFDETVNGTRYFNLGAFGRLSITEAYHIPKMAVVNTEDRSIYTMELIFVKTGHDAFNLTKYEGIKEKKKDIKEFLESLNSVQWESLSVEGQIEKIGKEQNIERDVIDYLIGKIGEVKNV